jgi:hypothetical protein
VDEVRQRAEFLLQLGEALLGGGEVGLFPIPRPAGQTQ